MIFKTIDSSVDKCFGYLLCGTALEKFIKYSQENHRGRKKKEIDE